MRTVKAKSYRRGKNGLGGVSFSPSDSSVSSKVPCICCGGEVETAPLIANVCYDCYRKIVDGEIADPRKEIVIDQAYASMDAVLGPEPATQREMESMIELFTKGGVMVVGSGQKRQSRPI